MKKAKVKILRGDKWQVERYLVLKKGKMYVPKNETLRIVLYYTWTLTFFFSFYLFFLI